MSMSLLVDALGWTLLHFLWQGTAIALVLAVGLRVAVRSVPQVRYAMACGGLILMAGMMAMTFGWELSHGFGRGATRSGVVVAHGPVVRDAQPTRLPSTPVTGVASDVGMPVVTPVMDRSRERVDTRRDFESTVGNWMPWVVGVWSAGAMVLAIRLFTSWRAVRKLQRGARVLAEPEWMERVGRLAKRLDISQPVRLLVSGAAAVPMVIGLLRPAILVPASLLTEMSVAQLEAILAHELAHIRRHDYLIHHFQSLVEVVGYYHPAVWWVSGQVRAEREHCCDDMASAVAGKLDYAQALTVLEEYRGSRLMLAATGGSLLQRIRRLAGLPAPSENSRAVWPLGLMTLLIGAGLALAVLPAGSQATAPDTTQAASPPDGVVDGVLSVELKAPPSPIDGMLPPDLVITASNATGEPIKWDFLKGELLADGKPWSSFTFPYNGPVGRSWSSLLPGEQFTYTLGLPEDLWKDGRPKVLQWRVGDHLSKGATLTWKPNAELKGKILEVLSKTSQSREVQLCLRGLQPIGRDALVAGLKDVLSAQRRGFTGEAYQEATRSVALLSVRSQKLTELAPEVRAIVQQGKDDELVKQAALAAMCLPGTVTPSDLIPYMKKDDPIFRGYVAGVLGVTKEDRDKAVTMLHELLDQEDGRPGKFEEHASVKIWASQSLGKLGDRGGIPIMIQLLSREETKDFRGNIKGVLEEITGQSPKDDQQWIDWWKSQATGTRASAAAVGPARVPATGQEAAELAPLLPDLASADFARREAGQKALEQLPADRYEMVAAVAAEQTDPEVKARLDARAAEMLMELTRKPTPASTRALLGLLTEKDEAIRDRAILALSDRIGISADDGGSDEVLPALAKILPVEKGEHVRATVCASANQYLKPWAPAKKPDAKRGPQAAEMLRERLKNDPSAEVRLWAACGLAEFGDNSGLSELEKDALAMEASGDGKLFGTGDNFFWVNIVLPPLEKATGQKFEPKPIDLTTQPYLMLHSDLVLRAEKKAKLELVVAWIKAHPSTEPATK